MTDYRKQRNTLILAASVILLCLISITGATLALFTSRNDGTIGINTTSGNLEVDIVDASDSPASLIGGVLKFTDSAEGLVSPETDILFEPGALYYTEGFRVVNSGEIPLNYIVYMSEDENFSDNFYDAFEVWITDNPSDREAMRRIDKFSGKLAVGESSSIHYLVFRMKSTAGNEYQNETFVGVGITVCAVQGNAIVD